MPTCVPGWDELLAAYPPVRNQTTQLVQPLADEDMLVQAMPQASPTKWHLAHTTWFFEKFILEETPGYQMFDPAFAFLFNSYYNALGDRIARHQRGVLSRPSLRQVVGYRKAVDEAMTHVRRQTDPSHATTLRTRLEVGLHHEQQHQELILTDILYAFWCNPLRPAYREPHSTPALETAPLRWLDHPGGLVEMGHGGQAFAYDNELPRHATYLRPFSIGSRLVSCAEYLQFMEAGGYRQPAWWLSDGWDTCRAQGWEAPLYWEQRGGQWWRFTLDGMRPVHGAEPVCHVSFYEADAYARWAGARLPTEAEWETLAVEQTLVGSFLDAGRLSPSAAQPGRSDWFGEAWQWTASPYVAYPGYRPPEGALGEYNAKFMVNQMVLRGGSCFTPRSHFRVSYRNFFPPEARWQVMGFRLARDA
ncbi:MAG: ergothioneine biosynthesis protein EgtB [Gemmataceae bacterium]